MKKKRHDCCRLCKNAGSQFFFIMRLSFALTLFAVMTVSANVDVLSQEVTLNFKDSELRDVFRSIREQTGHQIIYSEDRLQAGETKVSVSVENVALSEALHVLLRELPYTYVIKDQSVMIVPRPVAALQTSPNPVVTGRVVDQSGNPLPGVTVIIPGTTIGAATDANGRFSLTLPRREGIVLRFSYIGKQNVDVPYTGQAEVAVTMVDAVREIVDVVVTGVFDRPMESFTGAANLITKQELQQSSSQGLLTSIANIDPSFKFMPSNMFGSDPNKLNQAAITMRGGTALMDYQNDYANAVAANRPIFVIDGFVSSIDQFLALDESRVQSVTTLKDAAATALYGTQAANGVVVITTMQPKEGKLSVIYKGTFALEAPDLSSYNLMNSNEKLQFELESGLYDSPLPNTDRSLKNLYYSRKLLAARGVNTDWLRFPLRDAFSHNHAVTLSGGEGAVRYSLDIGNNRKSNVMKGSFNNTFNGVMYLHYSINDFVFSNRLSVTTAYGPNSPYGSFSDYTKLNAYYSPYDDNGNIIPVMDRNNYNISSNSAAGQAIALGSPQDIVRNSRNPLYNASLVSKNESRSTTLRNDFRAEWNITEYLKATGQFSITSLQGRSDVFKSPMHTDFENYGAADASRKGTYTYSPNQSLSYDGSIRLQYSRYFDDKHYLMVGATGRFYEYSSENYVIEVEGITVPYLDYYVAATQYKKDGNPGGGESILRRMSTSFLVNYMYDERLYVELNGSLDGSSEYGSKRNAAPTGTIGAGWNLHKENFMLDQQTISRFKLRTSYGIQGSAGSFNAYDALRLYDMVNTSYRGYPGMTLASLGNPDLKWQSTYQLNIGTDLYLFNDRLSIVFDWYNKITNDLVTRINIPTASGISAYMANIGKVRNRGWEFQLSAKVIDTYRDNGFDWTVMFNANHNKNTILEIGDYLDKFNADMISTSGKTTEEARAMRRNPAYFLREGESQQTLFAVKSKGIDPATGREIFVKLDGTETFDWSQDDYQAFGTQDPTLWGTFGTTVRYKNLALTAWFYFTTGAHKFNNALITKVENVYPYYNADKRALYDRWRNPGDVTMFKGLKEFKSDTRASSRFIVKENVLRNTSLSLQYTVSPAWVKRYLGAQFLQVQAQTEDLFYLTTLEDERGIYNPFSRNFSMTLRLTF